ncbi:amino acid ABC transporter permease [Catellatospora vulcania]|uniref:amino acid ABC transporter permease n=1 Tax=Catellatospora vulcania TaxID=1460450 RepID=UPI0012D3AF29|nr:amino acid ABC transporter permease [Catellatospora vulcania]
MSLLSSPSRESADPPKGEAAAAGQPALTVVPARHPWRWVATAAAAVLAAQFIHGLATNPGWDWPTFAGYFFEKSVMEALLVTLQLTFAGAALGFLGGIVLAAMRLSKSPVLQAFSWTFVWVFRSVPLIVQLLFWANLGYLYQTLQFGIPFGPGFAQVETVHLISSLGAALLGLALHEAAYAAEIVRSGIISVDQGQLEAAAALGIPRGRQFRRILLPQAMRAILPSAANELINLLKSTSVVYVLAIGELFYQVQVVYGRNGRVVALLMVATVWYVILTALLSVLQFYVERHFARGALRTLPPTPLQRLRAAVSGGVRLDSGASR